MCAGGEIWVRKWLAKWVREVESRETISREQTQVMKH